MFFYVFSAACRTSSLFSAFSRFALRAVMRSACNVALTGPVVICRCLDARHDPNPILHPVVFALKNHMRSLSQERRTETWFRWCAMEQTACLLKLCDQILTSVQVCSHLIFVSGQHSVSREGHWDVFGFAWPFRKADPSETLKVCGTDVLRVSVSQTYLMIKNLHLYIIYIYIYHLSCHFHSFPISESYRNHISIIRFWSWKLWCFTASHRLCLWLYDSFPGSAASSMAPIHPWERSKKQCKVNGFSKNALSQSSLIQKWTHFLSAFNEAPFGPDHLVSAMIFPGAHFQRGVPEIVLLNLHRHWLRAKTLGKCRMVPFTKTLKGYPRPSKT